MHRIRTQEVHKKKNKKRRRPVPSFHVQAEFIDFGGGCCFLQLVTTSTGEWSETIHVYGFLILKCYLYGRAVGPICPIRHLRSPFAFHMDAFRPIRSGGIKTPKRLSRNEGMGWVSSSWNLCGHTTYKCIYCILSKKIDGYIQIRQNKYSSKVCILSK